MILCCSNQELPSVSVLCQVSPSVGVRHAEEHHVTSDAVSPAESGPSRRAAPFRLAVEHESKQAVRLTSGDVAGPPNEVAVR